MALAQQLQTNNLKVYFGDVLRFIFVMCRNRRLKSSRYRIFERGEAKIVKGLDVKTLLRTQKRLKLLESVLFNRFQRVISKMSRWNYLSEHSSTSSDQEYPDARKLQLYVP